MSGTLRLPGRPPMTVDQFHRQLQAQAAQPPATPEVLEKRRHASVETRRRRRAVKAARRVSR